MNAIYCPDLVDGTFEYCINRRLGCEIAGTSLGSPAVHRGYYLVEQLVFAENDVVDSAR